MLKLAGIFAALPTPFDWEGNLYPVKVHHNVARWNRVALAGYLVGGRIGEAAELSIEEKLQLLALVPEAATAGMDAPRLLIAGVGTEGLREGIAISKKAAEMGYQAILADPTGREASLNYFRTLADRSALPVIVVAANAETAIAASQHPNVVAIVVPAEASALNAKSGVSSLKDSVRTGVQVLAGSAANLARDHRWLIHVERRLDAEPTLLFRRRPLPNHHHLGSDPHPRHRSRGRLAAPHRDRRSPGRIQIRPGRPETRNGLKRLLWRPPQAPPRALDPRRQS